MKKKFFMYLISFLVTLGLTVYNFLRLITVLSQRQLGEVGISIIYVLWGVILSIYIIYRYFSPRNR